MKYLSVEEENSILKVELNRPDVRNAFHPEMISELTSVFGKIDGGIFAVELSGRGESFCAGADLGWMKSMAEFTLEQNREDSLDLYDMFDAIWNCPVPVLTYVHGHVFGGALGIVACSDIVVAESQTAMCFSEVRLGLVPAVISDFVGKSCGFAKLGPYMMTGQKFDPKLALGAGLVHFVGSDKECSDYRASFRKSMTSSGPSAVRETKKLIRDVLASEDSRKLTTDVIAKARVESEGQEGLSAFFEKRKPRWVKR